MGKLAEARGADWIAKNAQRGGGAASLLAAAVSSDGKYLAVGGGDRKVHVWDARNRQYIQVSVWGHAPSEVTGFESHLAATTRCTSWTLAAGSASR